MYATSVRGGAICWTLTKDRQAWCIIHVWAPWDYAHYKWRYINTLSFPFYRVKLNQHAKNLRQRLSRPDTHWFTCRSDRYTWTTKVVGNHGHALTKVMMELRSLYSLFWRHQWTLEKHRNFRPWERPAVRVPHNPFFPSAPRLSGKKSYP